MYFVLARFDDEYLEELLLRLFELFNGRRPSSGIHVTIRGPYKHKPATRVLEKLESSINLEPLRLNGVWEFPGALRTVVLVVINDRLKRVWWKPDFPIERFGFHPHVTMAERVTPAVASRVKSALQAANLDLATKLAGISLHLAGAPQLFPERVPRARPRALPRHLEEAFVRAREAFNDPKWRGPGDQQTLGM